AIPRGQYDAADAIGLSYWQSTRRIVLPQALRIVIPALMNDIIRAFKNTTFVSIIGLFDLLGATKAALEDPRWIRFAPEAYLFVFAVYFVFCLSMSKYSESVERDLRTGRNFSCRMPPSLNSSASTNGLTISTCCAISISRLDAARRWSSAALPDRESRR